MNTKERIELEKLIAHKIFYELDINYNIEKGIINSIDPREIKEVITGDIIPLLNRILLKVSNGALYL